MVGPIGVCHRQSEARHPLAVTRGSPNLMTRLPSAVFFSEEQKLLVN